MERRTVVALAAAAIAAPRFLFAQQQANRAYRIATLDDAVESARALNWRAFRARLGELGFVDGKNTAYESRYARGIPERLPALATELVALKPDIIVACGTPPTRAAMNATSSIPVVFVGVGDPVRGGLVASLARPGGNSTGTSVLTFETGSKQLELLRDLSPSAKRIAFLANKQNTTEVAVFRDMERQSRALNMTLRLLDGRRRADLENSLATAKRDRLQGLIVGASALLLEHRDQIVGFAAREGLPVVYGRREYVDAGGLATYSPDFRWAYVRGAEFVERILKGAKPSELPVEQSSSARMVLNLKTARALGIRIPDSVRGRVDEVIE